MQGDKSEEGGECSLRPCFVCHLALLCIDELRWQLLVILGTHRLQKSSSKRREGETTWGGDGLSLVPGFQAMMDARRP